MSSTILLVSAMDVTVSPSSFSMSSIRTVSFSILASFLLIFQVRSAMVPLTFAYSLLHWSIFFSSSCSSVMSISWIISSMALITSSKWPALACATLTATRASLRLPALAAFALRAPNASRAGLPTSLEIWTKLAAWPPWWPSWMAVSNSVRASSLSRSSMAFLTPASSSSRNALLSDQSPAVVVHACFVASKNSTSWFSCASVSS
mmetsp:Transcript_71834/g.200484  ORF Transcript_71834/g.200484 Transcript_71834/m.200484 type:complete len:205 (-) Transcript_71834:944-1558(-)